jgi:hypothetical protein
MIRGTTNLDMVACPSVKSDVDCHNVCFLGWGFISLKNRGGLDNCIEENVSQTSLLNIKEMQQLK